MLLTITYRGKDAADLGYLLHKNPSRIQTFPLSFGQAHVFYPKVEDELCTAALLVDLNPIDLVRGKPDSAGGGLFDYINDRPYAVSSFMSTALSKVFSTAMKGRCEKRPFLASTALDLEANLSVLPCRGENSLIYRLFEPLGYSVSFKTFPLDERFPEWGDSEYVDLNLRANITLAELLTHLYVLIPVFDRQKHYWMSEDEVEKLLRFGQGWLAQHPEKELIARRYFFRKKGLANSALERLSQFSSNPGEDDKDEKESGQSEEVLSTEGEGISLGEQRMAAVAEALRESGARSVADLGCGEGILLYRLAKEPQIQRLLGMDVSVRALERAWDRLDLDRPHEGRRDRVSLIQGALTYKDTRIEGFDALCLTEVLEHLDRDRLPALERNIFEFAAPPTLIITTPNKEYNKVYEGLGPGLLRHTDHRFEWDRQEFSRWCNDMCRRYGYMVKISGIGEDSKEFGAPTQMGVFTKCE